MGIAPLKDGIRSNVRIDFYGHVHKRLRGTDADKRYAKEVEVLKVLEERGCPYVPRLLEEHPEELYFVSTNCGKLADQISKEKADKLFAKLEREYGVRHLDAEHHLRPETRPILHHRLRTRRNPAPAPRLGRPRKIHLTGIPIPRSKTNRDPSRHSSMGRPHPQRFAEAAQ